MKILILMPVVAYLSFSHAAVLLTETTMIITATVTTAKTSTTTAVTIITTTTSIPPEQQDIRLEKELLDSIVISNSATSHLAASIEPSHTTAVPSKASSTSGRIKNIKNETKTTTMPACWTEEERERWEPLIAIDGPMEPFPCSSRSTTITTTTAKPKKSTKMEMSMSVHLRDGIDMVLPIVESKTLPACWTEEDWQRRREEVKSLGPLAGLVHFKPPPYPCYQAPTTSTSPGSAHLSTTTVLLSKTTRPSFSPAETGTREFVRKRYIERTLRELPLDHYRNPASTSTISISIASYTFAITSKTRKTNIGDHIYSYLSWYKTTSPTGKSNVTKYTMEFWNTTETWTWTTPTNTGDLTSSPLPTVGEHDTVAPTNIATSSLNIFSRSYPEPESTAKPKSSEPGPWKLFPRTRLAGKPGHAQSSLNMESRTYPEPESTRTPKSTSGPGPWKLFPRTRHAGKRNRIIGSPNITYIPEDEYHKTATTTSSSARKTDFATPDSYGGEWYSEYSVRTTETEQQPFSDPYVSTGYETEPPTVTLPVYSKMTHKTRVMRDTRPAEALTPNSQSANPTPTRTHENKVFRPTDLAIEGETCYTISKHCALGLKCVPHMERGGPFRVIGGRADITGVCEKGGNGHPACWNEGTGEQCEEVAGRCHCRGITVNGENGTKEDHSYETPE
ncbi:hypothetical protein EJ08DRAFT_133405 [Tothia fuscella]|uniref:Uncharacterized protein n=1 Tax=Tothia fuscella TaxID=1048955 RepID=A0A9P4TZF4_9PEZI|nr:hypothetical protein EJ08DRAFT_133405 [Tothia fuscella]